MKHFTLRCQFPSCNRVIGEAFAKASQERSLQLAHICTMPCAVKKGIVERSAVNKTRAQVKSEIKGIPDFAEKPTNEEIDFIFDNYLGR